MFESQNRSINFMEHLYGLFNKVSSPGYNIEIKIFRKSSIFLINYGINQDTSFKYTRILILMFFPIPYYIDSFIENRITFLNDILLCYFNLYIRDDSDTYKFHSIGKNISL